MAVINKTRYAILGMLLQGSCTGYEIKSFMERSTVYFWRESDSTIYPMLKVLAKEGKVLSEMAWVGKKKKEIFSITELGRKELKAWMESPTGSETPRNEFLLKLFFMTDFNEMVVLFQERVDKAEKLHEEYKRIQERLEGMADSPEKTMRLIALRYGMDLLKAEIHVLNREIKQ